ncbi:MAG: class I mannose-6-phosphate isomerase [Rhodomicrobium sp.]
MTIEHACMQVVHKPWGSSDLRPWSELQAGGNPIGELWFQRTDLTASPPALLLKLLFTNEALSIQVHPDDAFAQSIGMEHGKTEAWYILSAASGAQVAVGLKGQLTAPQLRAAIDDGSIADLVQWHLVRKDDTVFVPAGTIHAIGAGLVIAEIQQRSDATFRLFDYGRQRELHAGNAVAAARAGPAECQSIQKRLTNARTLLVASSHFVLERIDLLSKSNWELHAGRETWLFVLEGHARIGLMNAFAGEAMFLEAEDTGIEVGAGGMKGLLAYLATEPSTGLLRSRERHKGNFPMHRFSRPPLIHRATAASPVRSTEARP